MAGHRDEERLLVDYLDWCWNDKQRSPKRRSRNSRSSASWAKSRLWKVRRNSIARTGDRCTRCGLCKKLCSLIKRIKRTEVL